ncbi:MULTISPECIES: hypothetical protein [Streptomyces]|uniref:Uncharacterized protein n=3 Tax=Streptomyces TaxID=1883 RepID=A0A1D8G9K2_9ACTN|nr:MULTISPECIES: hypothetical protein [Streptomyces]AOT62129.1 hypothetical protein A4G23_05022 [Streptomyces rubrolavendulae]KAF0648276.1 hypothetical protein K701_19600 [Streptomyces fradiae ATCC 10745 = DSM 40063]OSY53290.1 hypothetical protein BG846_01018 [Streptomyces fradiae ATCC 10745 = DSM 40063]QEV14990.1 hypothetical protein CP974_26835 [Streptomyces fradiae ATCC 10745 = DSM 40063]UQS29817.1 hypothetical protein J5J01_23440 [Streptomyces fradiae]
MNQIGDKPEEVRRHQEEERRARGRDERDRRTEDAPDARGEHKERGAVRGAVPDDADETYSTFDAYEEPEDRP